MRLLRSEEHVDRWLAGRPPGATITATKLGELAHAWWGDRLAPDWRPHTREQNQAILDRLGLTGAFWRLP
jgi:aryl-alcohol dehydrogenase-like predicted oxidoreductase